MATSTRTPTPDPGVPRPRLVRGAWILMGVVAIAVVATMAILWPDIDSGAVGPESRLPDTERAKVVGTRSVECQVPSADECVEATVRLETGPDRGDQVAMILGEAGDDSAPEVGDVVRVVKSTVPEGGQIGGVQVPPYSFSDYERRAPTLWLVGIFALIVLIAGRFHGLRALIGLGASMLVVVWFIIPALVEGTQPLVVAVAGALAVMFLTIPLAHGLGTVTVAATLGTTCALLLTLALAVLFTELSHLTGFSGDEVAYLSAYLGELSVQGLLLAGIVISALGVLDDVTVSQASTVMALRRAAPDMPYARLLRESLLVGRDHITATINTLVLAYAGASLPVLLVFAIGDIGVGDAFNSEAVASQVVAALVGSIGLIAAMPITTAIAALLATSMSPGQLDHATAHAHAHTHG